MPYLLINARFVLLKLAVYQLSGDSENFSWLDPMLAIAEKSSTFKITLLLKVPVRISINRLPCVLKALVPTNPCLLIFTCAEVMSASSGMEIVLKERIPRYCRSLLSSPKLMMLAVLSRIPPLLVFSPDSRIQPS